VEGTVREVKRRVRDINLRTLVDIFRTARVQMLHVGRRYGVEDKQHKSRSKRVII